VLDDTIAAIHSIHDQVVEHINRDTPLDEMIIRVCQYLTEPWLEERR
jgi:hypothetical protein